MRVHVYQSDCDYSTLQIVKESMRTQPEHVHEGLRINLPHSERPALTDSRNAITFWFKNMEEAKKYFTNILHFIKQS